MMLPIFSYINVVYGILSELYCLVKEHMRHSLACYEPEQ